MYYVIQVKTGKEQKAIDDILKNKPDDASFDVFAPYRKSLRKYKGELREVKRSHRKMLPWLYFCRNK